MNNKWEENSKDWIIRILLGIAAFFLTMTYLTVERTSSDVSDMKEQVLIIQSQYSSLNQRLTNLEKNSYSNQNTQK